MQTGETPMTNIVDLKGWKRARLGAPENAPRNRRARPTSREGGPGFVTIGVVSAELVRALMEK